MLENGKSRSSVKIFCLTVRKKIVGTTSKFQKIWDLGNFYAFNGFPSILFVSECRNFSLGNTSVYQKSSAIEKIHA